MNYKVIEINKILKDYLNAFSVRKRICSGTLKAAFRGVVNLFNVTGEGIASVTDSYFASISIGIVC